MPRGVKAVWGKEAASGNKEEAPFWATFTREKKLQAKCLVGLEQSSGPGPKSSELYATVGTKHLSISTAQLAVCTWAGYFMES